MKNRQWKRIIAGILLVTTVASCSLISNKQADSTVPPIDLYAKTKGEDHVFLGANVPFGTLQIGPQTRGTSTGVGYNYNDSIITGFILSYTGEDKETLVINHENDIRFFPSTKNEHETKFTHHYEVVKPGYYSIFMHEADVAVELTATKHTAFQRYFFPPTDSVQVVIDKQLTLINDSTLTGETPSTHFVVQFSRPAKAILKENAHETKFLFDATDNEMLYIKVAVSPESAQSALSHLESELPDWDYERMAAQANQTWNEYLIKD
ncbi:hypothetical protein [Bacteroides sp. 51]|uniref:hypothetical protein n=1 Tax=Bacteroides sp. 51 TaxID=2302938 RepID=UPI0013D214D1|nr:hypothetical protein [Bacteroides sp. 51]